MANPYAGWNSDNITGNDLIRFEERISDLYGSAKIRAPVHLSKGNEDQIIEIFEHVKKDDWLFSNYRNHYQALLKGMPPELLEEKILEGHSMHIMSKEHKIYTSSIVPGQLPIALGAAMALKLKNSDNHVWAFCGDMASETGVFHEVVKYAEGHDLPITFVSEDDSLSVYTPTREVWGLNDDMPPVTSLSSQPNYENRDLGDLLEKKSKTIKYGYERQWPHHGIGLWVNFPDEVKPERGEGPSYKEEINRAMNLLGEDERTIFLGQTVGFKGSPVYGTLAGVDESKKFELPIMEEVQMGMSTGLALEGYIPVSVYPRFDFMILATNQLVNHLDKTKELSEGEFNPKVIVRTMVGSTEPLYPGPQHSQDHTEAYRSMLTNMDVYRLERAEDVVPTYLKALNSDRSSLVVELVELFD